MLLQNCKAVACPSICAIHCLSTMLVRKMRS